MIEIKAIDLYNAVKKVKRVEFSKLPVLNHALFQLTDDGIQIVTTDLKKPLCETVHFWGNGERWATCVPMISKYDASTTFKPKWRKVYPFLDYLNIMTEYNEVLKIDFVPLTQTMIIMADKSRTELKCLDAQEFPDFSNRNLIPA